MATEPRKVEQAGELSKDTNHLSDELEASRKLHPKHIQLLLINEPLLNRKELYKFVFLNFNFHFNVWIHHIAQVPSLWWGKNMSNMKWHGEIILSAEYNRLSNDGAKGCSRSCRSILHDVLEKLMKWQVVNRHLQTQNRPKLLSAASGCRWRKSDRWDSVSFRMQ